MTVKWGPTPEQRKKVEQSEVEYLPNVGLLLSRAADPTGGSFKEKMAKREALEKIDGAKSR